MNKNYKLIVVIVLLMSCVPSNCMDDFIEESDDLKKFGYKLHCLSCVVGSEAVVDRLLKEGARVDTLNRAGYMPLHLACMFGCERNVHLLVEHGADPNARDRRGNTALHSACIGKMYGHMPDLKSAYAI